MLTFVKYITNKDSHRIALIRGITKEILSYIRPINTNLCVTLILYNSTSKHTVHTQFWQSWSNKHVSRISPLPVATNQAQSYLLDSSIPLCKWSSKHFSIDASCSSARDSHSRPSSPSISSSGNSELTTKLAGSPSTAHGVVAWWSILVLTGDMINCRISCMIYLGSFTVLCTILNLHEEKKIVSAEVSRLINSDVIAL